YLEKGPLCSRCGKKSYPSRFVVSCSQGNHLDDFPWHWWSHKKSGNFTCDGELQLSSSGNNSGLSSITVKCLKCDDWNHMGQATQKSSFSELRCRGNHPHKMNAKTKCDGELIPLQRGASNVYFPVLRSAISIPEKKNEKSLVIEQNAIFLREI